MATFGIDEPEKCSGNSYSSYCGSNNIFNGDITSLFGYDSIINSPASLRVIESKQKLEDYRDRWSSYPTDIPNSESICTLIEELIAL
jgi:hypothetical protein